MTAKDLENILFSLDEDQILNITGFIPNPSKIKTLNYSILNEVINHIMEIPLDRSKSIDDIYLPDWDKKIEFNGLSTSIKNLLESGYPKIYSLEKYLENNGNFISEQLRNKLNETYLILKKSKKCDDLFWAIVDKLSPFQESSYQTVVIIIMAKYFETCDIFEEPKFLKEGKK
jgi:hypothetical protein